MKFYMVEIAEGDDKIKGKAIYEYDNLIDAEASFHKKLGVAMASEMYKSDLCIVMDSDGTVHRIERYLAPVSSEEE